MRTLLIAITVLALPFAVWNWAVRPYQLSESLRQQIAVMGGSYRMEAGPIWIRWLFGDQYGAYATEIDLNADFRMIAKGPHSSQCFFCELGELTELRVLRLRNQPVTEECIDSWRNLHHLEVLDLEGTLVTRVDNWPQWPLRELNLSDTPIESGGFAGVLAFSKLQVLTVRSTGLSDEEFPLLLSLKELQRFDGSDCRITPQGWDVLSQLPKNCLLAIDGWQFWDASPFQTADYRNTEVTDYAGILEYRESLLKQVTSSLINNVQMRPLLDGTGTLSTAINGLQYLEMKSVGPQPDVTGLALNSPYVGDEQLECLREFPNLEILDLTDAWITDASLAMLKSCPHLEYLSLDDTRIGDAGIDAITNLQNLRSLTMKGTRVTEFGSAKLARLQHVEYLQIPRAAFRGQALDAILAMPELQTLVIRPTGKWDSSSRLLAPVAQSDVDKIIKIADLLVVRNDTDGDGLVSTEENSALSLFYGHPSRERVAAWLLVLARLPEDSEEMLGAGIKKEMEQIRDPSQLPVFEWPRH